MYRAPDVQALATEQRHQLTAFWVEGWPAGVGNKDLKFGLNCVALPHGSSASFDSLTNDERDVKLYPSLE
jgi:hypothetical protein